MCKGTFTYCKYVLFCIYDTESTDRVFLRYRYGKYQEIPTDTDQKILTQYTTLVPSMHPAQPEACYRLLHPHLPNLLVVVHRTGRGKTHILCTLGVIECGIVLIFTPLLTLSVNVMHKFEGAILIWGNVGVNHLDKIFDSKRSTYFALLCRCASMSRRTTSTIFIYLSPQFLVNHQDAHNVFIECANECTLWVIAMDEAHIHVQHGTSFQEDIRALRVELF